MPFRFFRAFAVAAALGTVVSTVPSVAVHSTGVSASSSHQSQPSVVELNLAGVRADAIRSLPSPNSVPLDDGPAATTVRPAAAALAGTGNLPQVRPHPRMLTAKLDTKPFTVLGVTWDLTHGLGDVVIRYRVRQSGRWTSWSGVSASDAAPDPGTPDAKAGGRGGTDPIVAVGADGLQVWAETSSGTLSGIKAVLVDPGADAVGATAAVRTTAAKRNLVNRIKQEGVSI